jgi:hypothetical protein
MEIPQAMLLDWAKRIDGGGMMLNTREVARVQREIATYATASEAMREQLRRNFYNSPEN